MPRQLTNRGLILDGACSLARRYGLSSISIRGVAKECVVSTGTIYTYYPSRDELVAAAVERLFGEAFYEGFCHPSPNEGYIAFCRRLYLSLTERLSQEGSNWLGQLQGLEPGAREAGRRHMADLLAHMLDGLESVLSNDPQVRRDVLAGDLDATSVCRFTLNGMFDAVRRGEPDCETMLDLIERALYEEIPRSTPTD